MTTVEYPKDDIAIVWKPELCVHSGVCVMSLPRVYRPKVRPWIRVANASKEELIAQVARCPSGALTIKTIVADDQPAQL
ncbi:MAG: (4Fe-4S)-binding protein [Chitinophagaceae bacterium]|nr:MAG: (4Fe-4S)-binding protein [Chitinophagaceae bacterium]